MTPEVFARLGMAVARIASPMLWISAACLRAAIVLAAMLPSFPAKAEVIWIALSSKDPAYQEAANALREGLQGDEVRVAEWRELNFKATPPQKLITIGSEALSSLQQYADKVPILAILTPRSTLDEIRDATGGRITGVYYEQPIPRQATLLRAAFPGKNRIGVLLGPSSDRYRNELSTAFRKQGLEGMFEVIRDKRELAEAAQHVLSNSEVFLALPDAEAINNQSARFILLSSYRRGIPVVGYSASFVKAGAAVALVSSPTQLGMEAAAMVKEIGSGRRLPAPRVPADFDVLINTSVARSLSLPLDGAKLRARLRDEEAPR